MTPRSEIIMRWKWLLFAALVASPACQAAETLEPRAVVGAVARTVAEVYFDPAKGARIARELRAEAKAGQFDRHTEPADLAAALSRRLRPEDGHFRVDFAAIGSLPAVGPGGTPRRQHPGHNHGFRRVEILPGKVGYIAMDGFAAINFADPDDPVRRQADAALAATRTAEAVIIDVRDSPGGSPAMVGYLVSAYTPPDARIYNVFHFRGGTAVEAPGRFHPRPRLDTPLYILTSRRTASAAEALAYTLQAAKRAHVVGEVSAGAANPGGFVDLGNGFRVFVSSGSPINPIMGRNWEGTGVVPDHEVPAEQALATAQALARKRR